MKTEFKNGSSIRAKKSEDVVRGERSHYYECVCYDIENDIFVWKQLDWRKPINRFIFVETDIPVDNFAELQPGIISSFSIEVKYN
jgi:hypothetical protein